MTHSPNPTAGREADHLALRQIKDVFEKAVAENQLDLIKPYLDDYFSVVTFTDREFKDFEAFKARWQKTRDEMLKGGRYTITLEAEPAQIYEDLAVAHGNSENILVTGGGKEHRFNSHWTVVFRKVGSQWKIVRAHNSLDPFGNPMLKAAVRKVAMMFCAGALAVGIILGWLIKAMMVR